MEVASNIHPYAGLKKMHRLEDLNIGHWVELTCLKGKLGRFLTLPFLKWKYF